MCRTRESEFFGHMARTLKGLDPFGESSLCEQSEAQVQERLRRLEHRVGLLGDRVRASRELLGRDTFVALQRTPRQERAELREFWRWPAVLQLRQQLIDELLSS